MLSYRATPHSLEVEQWRQNMLHLTVLLCSCVGNRWSLNCPGENMPSSEQGQWYHEIECARALLQIGSESLVVSLDLGS